MSINANFESLSKKKISPNPLRHPSLSLFIGPTRSGKTTAMLQYLSALADEVDFDQVLFVSANKKDALLDLLDEDIEVTSDPVRLEEWILSVMKQMNPKKYNKLLILDDLMGSKMFASLMTNKSEISELVINHRHLNCWIVATCQTFKGCYVPNIRKQASMLFLFPPRGKTEIDAIEKEVDAPVEKIRTAFKVVKAQSGKNFLYINLSESHPRFYINFREPIDL
jgi:hypothetical protein